jgi:hypothetical protein
MTHLHWLGLPWTSDRPVALVTTHNKQERQTSMPRRNSNPQSQQARCHRDRRLPLNLRGTKSNVRTVAMFLSRNTYIHGPPPYQKSHVHQADGQKSSSCTLHNYHHVSFQNMTSKILQETMALRYPSVTSGLHQLSCTCVSRTNALAVSRCYNHFSLLRTEIRLEVLSSVTPPRHTHTVQCM